MDPLSITVATLALLSAVRKTLKTSKAFVRAPEQLDSLLNDLSDAKLLITNVELSLQESGQKKKLPNRLHDQVCKTLEEAKNQLSDLLQLVSKFTPDDTGPNFKQAAHWIIAKGKVERFKGKLEAVCENLREALGEYKTSCIELELQNISVALVDASSQRSSLSVEVSQGFDEVVQEQRDGFAQQRDGFAQSNIHQIQILNKLSDLENYMYTENLPTAEATQGVSEPTNKYAQSYQRVAVRAAQRKSMCDSDTCTCECHLPQTAHDQTTLRQLLGSIFAGYAGQPASLKRCNNRFCQRVTNSPSWVTYYFPRWWFAQRMLSLVVELSARSSMSSLPAPARIVPAPARIFRHAAKGQTDVLRDMFAAGLGSPNDTDAETGVTPLHYACDQVQEQTIKYLLSRGADRTQKSFEGLSAVGEAWTRLLANSIPKEKRPILEAICDEEDLDEFEFTDLHRSVVRLSPCSVKDEIKRLLRRTDATIDDLDAQGRSAVSWAAQCGDFEALQTLLEYGAATESPKGTKTPLHFAAGMTKSTACVSILLEYGADPHAVDVANMNGLMWACVNFQKHFASVKPLIPVSNLEHMDINGRTALFHAASTALAPTQTLLAAGANVNHADKDGFTALHMSILYNHTDIFLALQEAGADYLATRSNGQNLLHHAASYASVEMLHAMLFAQLRGLAIESRDFESCSPRDRFRLRIPAPTPELEAAFDQLLNQIVTLKLLAIRTAQLADGISPRSSVDFATPVTWHTASENGDGREESPEREMEEKDEVHWHSVEKGDFDVGETHEITERS